MRGIGVRLVTALLCGLTGLVAVMSYGGPLNPPSGPVASSYKTLSEVEPRIAISSVPYTITSPGSYYLTGNLTSTQSLASAIAVQSDDVSIDLNGFVLQVSSGYYGISSSSHQRVCVRNGSIKAYGSGGVFLAQCPHCRIEDVRVWQVPNASFGIYTGASSEVTNCQIDGGNVGFVAADGSVVRGCTASGCAYGVLGGATVIVEDCVALSGGYGFRLPDGKCTVRGCTARECSVAGFQIGGGGTVVNCTSDLNTGDGFLLEGAGQLLGCTASTNTGNGVTLGPSGGPVAAVIEGCSLNFNGGVGISHDSGGGSTIRNNTISRNGTGGIVIRDGNLVCGNHIIDNGWNASGAGIQVNGLVNTIRGNDFLNNTKLFVFASGTYGNTFYGNSCSGGTQQNLGSNAIAPMVASATAFSGGSLANSNAFVNVTY